MKKSAIAVLALAMVIALTAVAPTFGKDMNLPEGATVVDYWSGGVCLVQITSTWPPNPAVPTTTIRIDARHHEAGTYGAHDSINIDVRTGTGSWLPVTYFTTNSNPEFLTFIKKVYYKLPIGMGTGNARAVSDSDLKVERHGNRITVELNTEFTVGWTRKPTTPPGPPVTTVTIPKFKLEMDQSGRSIHEYFVEDLTGYSNYVFTEDMMGFDGTSVFQCSAFSFVDPPGTLSPRPYCGITMHGITIYYPPPQ